MIKSYGSSLTVKHDDRTGFFFQEGYEAAAKDDAEEFKRLDAEVARLSAALTEIRDILPLQNDEYARRVFKIAANALEPETTD